MVILHYGQSYPLPGRAGTWRTGAPRLAGRAGYRPCAHAPTPAADVRRPGQQLSRPRPGPDRPAARTARLPDAPSRPHAYPAVPAAPGLAAAGRAVAALGRGA